MGFEAHGLTLDALVPVRPERPSFYRVGTMQEMMVRGQGCSTSQPRGALGPVQSGSKSQQLHFQEFFTPFVKHSPYFLKKMISTYN